MQSRREFLTALTSALAIGPVLARIPDPNSIQTVVVAIKTYYNGRLVSTAWQSVPPPNGKAWTREDLNNCRYGVITRPKSHLVTGRIN